MGPDQRSGILAADHDRSEHRYSRKPDQRTWRDTRVRTSRHAVGRTNIPVERPGRIQAGDLLSPPDLTALKKEKSLLLAGHGLAVIEFDYHL